MSLPEAVIQSLLKYLHIICKNLSHRQDPATDFNKKNDLKLSPLRIL